MDDATLVQQCLRGEVAATQQLIERFQGEVFGLCVRLLSHRQDAEDVTQEVFLRLFRSLHRWDSTRPLRPWLMGITVNRCRTWMSRRGRRAEPVDYLHDVPARDEVDDSTELVTELQEALQQLRDEYRIVFVMFHEHGHPYEEIAEALDRPVGTIKTWLHRARAELLERLKRRGMITDDPAENWHLTRQQPS